MNIAIISGRLTRDPEVRESASGVKVARYTLAVDRIGDGTDFIDCVTFKKNAEFAEKYLKKGTKIIVEGNIQTGSYENKEGKKVKTVNICVNRHEFCESKNAKNTEEMPPKADSNGFMEVPDSIEEELPFF